MNSLDKATAARCTIIEDSLPTEYYVFALHITKLTDACYDEERWLNEYVPL